MTLTRKRSLVALIEGEHDNLKVVKLDGDQFILTAQQAVNACSAASDSVLFQAQFRDLLDKLYEWVEERKARVASAYISTGQEGVLLLVVQKGIKADFELEDELVQLDLDIANSKHIELVPFNTLLVPDVSDEVLQSFLSSSTNLSHKLHA